MIKIEIKRTIVIEGIVPTDTPMLPRNIYRDIWVRFQMEEAMTTYKYLRGIPYTVGWADVQSEHHTIYSPKYRPLRGGLTWRLVVCILMGECRDCCSASRLNISPFNPYILRHAFNQLFVEKGDGIQMIVTVRN